MYYELRLTQDGWVQRFLISQPETGMGYQQVDVELSDGRIIAKVAVFSAQTILLQTQYKGVDENDILRITMPDGTACDKPAN